MADTQRLRLFVAFSMPRDLLDAIEQKIAMVRDGLPDARWIPVENQHVTLKFLGSSPAETLGEVVTAARGVAAGTEPFRTRFEPPGAFPNARRARVLWIGLEDRAGHMAALAADLDQALSPLGYEPEKRAFSPHLTLARFKIPTPVTLPDVPVGDFPPFAVHDIGLYRSHLHPKGARYELVESLLLGA
ncbi:MAG: RNA 2',3'-cyclic phosphodiesterase [Actinomycetota bacterium]|nr:RNA 2',3'-cyclic phosphodiesterase [Actinomycetota bacterium]